MVPWGLPHERFIHPGSLRLPDHRDKKKYVPPKGKPRAHGPLGAHVRLCPSE